jgi:hypothetical protein
MATSTTLYLPGQYQSDFDPSISSNRNPIDRQGTFINPVQQRWALVAHEIETIYDYNNLAVTQTITAASIIGGRIRAQNANAAIQLTMPNIAAFAPLFNRTYCTHSALQNGVAAVVANNNAPGSEVTSLVFKVFNASAQALTIAQSGATAADIVLDTASTAAGRNVVAANTAALFEISFVRSSAGTLSARLNRLS